MPKYKITPEAKLTSIIIELKDVLGALPTKEKYPGIVGFVIQRSIFELSMALNLLKQKA